MPFVAPWLHPPNFLGAMESGANTGLRIRAMDEAQEQAADRLRLAYDQLAVQERNRVAELAARQAQAEAANQLRQAQMDAMERYRRDQLSLAQQRIDAAGIVKESPKLHFGAQGGIYKVNPDATFETLQEPKEKPEKNELTGQQALANWNKLREDYGKTMDESVKASMDAQGEYIKENYPGLRKIIEDGEKVPVVTIPEDTRGLFGRMFKSAPQPVTNWVARANAPKGAGASLTIVEPTSGHTMPDLPPAVESKSEYPPAPPKAQRKEGQIYQTPKGNYRWTVNEWEEI